MVHSLLALGSNRGDRRRYLNTACQAVNSLVGVTVQASSDLFSTQPVGGRSGQGVFLNAALTAEVSLRPEALMVECRRIEQELGRESSGRWDERVIDIDLILYGSEQINSDDLVVPHPRFAYRRFVLLPARSIAGEMTDPNTGRTVSELAARLDRLPHRIAVVGVEAADLAQRAAKQSGVAYNRLKADQASIMDHWPDSLAEPTLVVAVQSDIEVDEHVQTVIQQAAERQIPWLIVPGSDPTWAVTEISAAMQAMS